jgi:hypothetical protein
MEDEKAKNIKNDIAKIVTKKFIKVENQAFVNLVIQEVKEIISKERNTL